MGQILGAVDSAILPEWGAVLVSNWKLPTYSCASLLPIMFASLLAVGAFLLTIEGVLLTAGKVHLRT